MSPHPKECIKCIKNISLFNSIDIPIEWCARLSLAGGGDDMTTVQLQLLRCARFHFAMLFTLLSTLFVVVYVDVRHLGQHWGTYARRMLKKISNERLCAVLTWLCWMQLLQTFFVALWDAAVVLEYESVKQQQNIAKICILKCMDDVYNIFGVSDVSWALFVVCSVWPNIGEHKRKLILIACI